MNRKGTALFSIAVSVLLLASCTSGNGTQQSQGQSYKDTKTIVLDVLSTEEGQKAIHQALEQNKDKTMKLLSTGEGVQLQLAVKETLTNEIGQTLLRKTMTDPQFAGEFAKAIRETDAELHKELIKDPDYQKSLLEALNNPEFEQLLMGLMKNAQYRQQIMNIMQDAMNNPIFQMQMMELMQKAVEKGVQSQEDQQGGQESKEEKQSGEKKEGEQQEKEGEGKEEAKGDASD